MNNVYKLLLGILVLAGSSQVIKAEDWEVVMPSGFESPFVEGPVRTNEAEGRYRGYQLGWGGPAVSKRLSGPDAEIIEFRRNQSIPEEFQPTPEERRRFYEELAALYRRQQTELNRWLRDQGHSIRQSGY